MAFGSACEAEGNTGWAEEAEWSEGASRGAGLAVAEVSCGALGKEANRVKEDLECQGGAPGVLEVLIWGWPVQL